MRYKMKKKGNIVIIIMMVIAVLALAAVSLASNADGVMNWFYDDVESNTPVAPGCDPQRYLVSFTGELYLVNQKQGSYLIGDYDIDYIDAHISDIRFSKELGIFSNEFDSSVCLFDVIAGGDQWYEKKVDCVSINEAVTKGRIEKFPFTFKYNLYDNDCNGDVDDHTFNLVVTLDTEDDTTNFEKTVTIINGEPVFQNVEGIWVT